MLPVVTGPCRTQQPKTPLGFPMWLEQPKHLSYHLLLPRRYHQEAWLEIEFRDGMWGRLSWRLTLLCHTIHPYMSYFDKYLLLLPVSKWVIHCLAVELSSFAVM